GYPHTLDEDTQGTFLSFSYSRHLFVSPKHNKHHSTLVQNGMAPVACPLPCILEYLQGNWFSKIDSPTAKISKCDGIRKQCTAKISKPP
ncbi:MAG: hypothetical protein IJ456_01195, partial [Bacteroides sp.]|nr:hypothetical protein [Bacteroides sp.]